MDLESTRYVTTRNLELDVTRPCHESPPQEQTGYTPPVIDQSHDVALVLRLLNRSHDCHGVCSERILLWGLPGCGKRRIATQSALTFSNATGCKILFIDGRTYEVFVRDFRTAYATITGDTLPQGLAVEALMLKIKITLESRRQEWLMVIFDLQFYLEEGADPLPGGPDSALTSFLPERCRILATSSYVVPSVTGSVDQDVSLKYGLAFGRWATCLHVVGLDEKKTIYYLKESGLPSTGVEVLKRDEGSLLSIPPLRLALSCAVLRLRRIDLSQFRRLCDLKIKAGTVLSWPGSTTAFSLTMSILWDALNDYEPLAARILAIASVVDRIDVPVPLLKRFPIFQTIDEDIFSAAVNILLLSGLIETHQRFGVRTINMALTVYRWVELRLRAVDDEEEYLAIVRRWAFILTDYLTVPGQDQTPEDRVFSAERFWPLVGHVTVLCNFKSSLLPYLCSTGYMTFLKRAAILLIEDGVHSSLGHIAITHALEMCVMLKDQSRTQGQEIKLHREYVVMLQVRALAFSKALKFTEARSELREAERHLNRYLVTDVCYATQRRQIDDAKVHVSISQLDFPEAVRLLTPLIASPGAGEDPDITVKRHFWMTPCKTAVKADVGALKHSHMVMNHWRTLSVRERWGYGDGRKLLWVENHMICLMCMGKFKGALVFGIPLLKRARELTPTFGISLCRVTQVVVSCLGTVGKLEEAEDAVCQLLTQSEFGAVGDETRCRLLLVLQSLAQLLQTHGRTIEAEGVYRYILRTARQGNVQNVSGTGKYDVTSAWTRLVMCLIEQGKHWEARCVRREYGDPEDEERSSRLIRRATKAYHHMKDVYAKRLEAERSGTLIEWEALVDLYHMQPDLNEGIDMFGDPKQRIDLDRDFESDINIHGIAEARRSRILQLLNFPLVYQSFVQLSVRFGVSDESPEELWCNRSQTILGQYWQVCECRRKRPRSRSIDLNALVDGSFVFRRDLTPRQTQPRFKQKPITDWIVRTPISRPIPQGCSPSCPCIKANAAVDAESDRYESNLFIWKNSGDESTPTPKHRPRYRSQAVNRSPIPDNEIFTYDSRERSWLWLQSEFRDGDTEGESYIIPNALEIPRISITPPDGQKELLPEEKYPQTRITKYYERDFAAEFARAVDKSRATPFGFHRLDDVLEDDEDEI